MNRYLIPILLMLTIVSCRKYHSNPSPATGCLSANEVNELIVPASEIKDIIEDYLSQELPGITFMARKGNHYWQYNGGKCNLEQNAPMKPCLVWPGYSISKLYTATVIMKLTEDNRINLDKSINTYLPNDIILKVPLADKITVRMLMNHSSGIENFWENPYFVAGYIEDPSRRYQLNDYLNASQQRLFEPGTGIAYSNTNYLLLSLIIDKVTGQSHEKAFQQYIFNPLTLSASFYKSLPQNQQNNSPSLYADVDGSGNLIEYTALSHIQFLNESGSNSILATPKDFVDLMHGLTHGKLLNADSFSEMKKEYTGNDGADIYGLGLEYFQNNGTKLYGYSGSSFGGRTLLLYNPKTDVSFFVGVNAGAELGGPVLETISGLMNELISKMTQ